jgi:sugar lactone lactonase YvrE
MPSAASYTNKIRFAASVKNTKAQLVGGVGNLTQGSIAGCGLDIQYNRIDYVEVCGCNKNPPYVAPPKEKVLYIDELIRITGVLNPINRTRAHSDGYVYFVSIAQKNVQKINTTTKSITPVAGTGVGGFSGDGYAATGAKLELPRDIAFDSIGNLYIADTGNRRIRKVNAGDGKINTIAGTGDSGSAGDGSLAINAQITPYSLECDSSDNLYIIDVTADCLRKIELNTGIITRVSGPGGFNSQYDVIACDALGNVYISDISDSAVRKVNLSTGALTPVAGTGVGGFSGDGGAAIYAKLQNQYGLTSDSVGNLYIADTGNRRIRKVNASDGKINTIAGTGDSGATGITVDSVGNIYINNNSIIRKLYYA